MSRFDRWKHLDDFGGLYSTRNKFGSPSSHEFVRDAWDCKTFDDAIAALEIAADNMPTMSSETARIEAAKAKLSDEERSLLGVR